MWLWTLSAPQSKLTSVGTAKQDVYMYIFVCSVRTRAGNMPWRGMETTLSCSCTMSTASPRNPREAGWGWGGNRRRVDPKKSDRSLNNLLRLLKHKGPRTSPCPTTLPLFPLIPEMHESPSPPTGSGSSFEKNPWYMVFRTPRWEVRLLSNVMLRGTVANPSHPGIAF